MDTYLFKLKIGNAELVVGHAGRDANAALASLLARSLEQPAILLHQYGATRGEDGKAQMAPLRRIAVFRDALESIVPDSPVHPVLPLPADQPG